MNNKDREIFNHIMGCIMENKGRNNRQDKINTMIDIFDYIRDNLNYMISSDSTFRNQGIWWKVIKNKLEELTREEPVFAQYRVSITDVIYNEGLIR